MTVCLPRFKVRLELLVTAIPTMKQLSDLTKAFMLLEHLPVSVISATARLVPQQTKNELPLRLEDGQSELIPALTDEVVASSEVTLVNCLDCDAPIGIEDSYYQDGLCYECYHEEEVDEWEDATIADDNYNDYGIIDCR